MSYLIETAEYAKLPADKQKQWKEESQLQSHMDGFAERIGKKGPIRLAVHHFDLFTEGWQPMTLRNAFSALHFDAKFDDGFKPTFAAAWTTDTIEFQFDAALKPSDQGPVGFGINAAGNLVICANKDGGFARAYGRALNSTLKSWATTGVTLPNGEPVGGGASATPVAVPEVELPLKDAGLLLDNAGSLRPDALANLLENVEAVDKALAADSIAAFNGSGNDVCLVVENWTLFLAFVENANYGPAVGNKLRDIMTTFGFAVLDPQGGGALSMEEVERELKKLWTTGTIRFRMDPPQGWNPLGTDCFEYDFEGGDLIMMINTDALDTRSLNFVGEALRNFVHAAIGGPPARDAGAPAVIPQGSRVKKVCRRCSGSKMGPRGKCVSCAGKGYKWVEE